MSNPITHIKRILLATERSRRRKKREKQKLTPYKIYFLQLDLDLEKKEASDSLYYIRRRNHIARSRSREEGRK
jgi:DUF1365 family protein